MDALLPFFDPESFSIAVPWLEMPALRTVRWVTVATIRPAFVLGRLRIVDEYAKSAASAIIEARERFS